MRLNDEEGNGASLAGRTSPKTAGIARTIGNAAVCRTFMRSVFFISCLPCAETALSTAAPTDSDRGLMRRNRQFSGSFLHFNVGAGGTFPSFP
jgi:hypothetical protein